jgi:hypothetical protein
MAYEVSGGAGMPMILGTGNGDSGFGGMGGLGGILIGALLGGGGLFGGNRGVAGMEGAQVAGIAGVQNQLNGMQNQMTTGLLNSEISGLESALNAANIANLQGISNNALTYQAGNAALQTALAGANYTTLASINALGRDVVTGANQNALEILNSFNNINTTMLQGFNTLNNANQNAFNQVQMGLNALSAQSAACCCEIKSAIFHDGNETRALINASNMATLQAQLSDAKNTINSQNIINSLRPVVVV